MFSVHGSNRFGKRTARSPRAMVQFERTVSEDALSTTVKSSWRFDSLRNEKDKMIESRRCCIWREIWK